MTDDIKPGEIRDSQHWHPQAETMVHNGEDALNYWGVVSAWTWALEQQGLDGQSARNIRVVVNHCAPEEAAVVGQWMEEIVSGGLTQQPRIRQLQQRLQEYLWTSLAEQHGEME